MTNETKQILMAARDAGGDAATLYRVWCYLRDLADGQEVAR